VKSEIGGLRGEVKSEIGGLRGEVKSDVNDLRGEMNGLRSDIKSMQRLMLYGFFTLGGILLTFAGFQVA